METLGVYAYSYRIDMSHCPWNEKELVKYVTHPDVKGYMFAREFKPKGHIPHYQGIIWFNSKRTSTEETYYRNFKKKKFVRKSTGKGDGTVSFKTAKKIGSLAKYCNDKEGFGLIKTENITHRMLEKLGKWSNEKQVKKTRQEIIKRFQDEFKLRYESEDSTPWMCAPHSRCLHNNYQGAKSLKELMCVCAYDIFINTDFNPPLFRHIPNMLKHILHKADYIWIVYHIETENNDSFENEPYESM